MRYFLFEKQAFIFNRLSKVIGKESISIILLLNLIVTDNFPGILFTSNRRDTNIV